MKRLILSVTTISLAGVLLLGSSQVFAQRASAQQQLAWDVDCVVTWDNSWVDNTCPGASVSHYIASNQQLACKAHNAKCPNNKGGTINMYWQNLKSRIPNARYCVLNNGKGKFFQQGSRPSNCQADNW